MSITSMYKHFMTVVINIYDTDVMFMTHPCLCHDTVLTLLSYVYDAGAK